MPETYAPKPQPPGQAKTAAASPEEYAAHCEKMSYPAGLPLIIVPGDVMQKIERERLAQKKAVHESPEAWEQSLAGMEKPSLGQTAWLKDTKQPVKIISVDGEYAWARPVFGGCGWVQKLDNITATDPNQSAEPEPQKCPFCGSKAISHEYLSGVCVAFCSNTSECKFQGPIRTSIQKAIDLWNAISVAKSSHQALDPRSVIRIEDTASPSQNPRR